MDQKKKLDGNEQGPSGSETRMVYDRGFVQVDYPEDVPRAKVVVALWEYEKTIAQPPKPSSTAD